MQLVKRKGKRKRGIILVVIMYAVLMGIVMLGMLRLASALYLSNQDTAKQYSNLQTFRSICEVAVYRYVVDGESIVISKNLENEWLEIKGSAMYNRALEVIQEELGSPADPNIWKISKVSDAIRGSGISDTTVTVDMVALLSGTSNKFTLSISPPWDFDWTSEETYIGKKDSLIKLKPFEVVVDLTAGAESLHEVFIIENLYLSVSVGSDKIAVMQLVEGEEGVLIYRNN